MFHSGACVSHAQIPQRIKPAMATQPTNTVAIDATALRMIQNMVMSLFFPCFENVLRFHAFLYRSHRAALPISNAMVEYAMTTASHFKVLGHVVPRKIKAVHNVIKRMAANPIIMSIKILRVSITLPRCLVGC